jgi:hypothetical protein
MNLEGYDGRCDIHLFMRYNQDGNNISSYEYEIIVLYGEMIRADRERPKYAGFCRISRSCFGPNHPNGA